jgi:hemolysin activation/secretion protein
MKSLFLAVLVTSPLAAHAAGLAVPDAGSILQQVKPATPQAASSKDTELDIEQSSEAKLPPSAPFEVMAIQIMGNSRFDTETLHGLVAASEGKILTLSSLDELATRLTDYYHSHGYPLARAFIPAQTIQNGKVRIEIIEAHYGKVKLDNRSRVKNSLLQATLSALQNGEPIEQVKLDHTLLLFSDIPGVGVSATLKPGELVGTSDLTVETMHTQMVTGNLSLDNYGNRFTGSARVAGTLTFYNPLHQGDYLGLYGMTSGNLMHYGRINYELLLNRYGTRLGTAYSSLSYVLGDTLSSIKGHGTAQTGSLWMKGTVKRGRDFNLYEQIQFDQTLLHDDIDTTALRTDRHLVNWSATLNGDSRDKWFSAESINTWNLSWTAGHVGFDNAVAQLSDAASAKTQGNFSKLNAGLARLQSLNLNNSFYVTFAAQQANGNLDSSQKMQLGGPYSIRAYSPGAASGDTGFSLSAELRHDLTQVQKGQWQEVVFIDTAQVAINKNVWGAGSNSATLTGIGVGLNGSISTQWSAKAYIAKPIGSIPVLSGNTSSVRAWVVIEKGFSD